MYLTLTEDYSEVTPEPKTGKAEGFDMGIKDFLTGSDGDTDILFSYVLHKVASNMLATER